MSMPHRKKPSPKKVVVNQHRQRRNRLRIPKWAWLTLALASVATLSAGTGALLAVSMNTQPLLQSQLSPEEEAIFSEGEPILTSSSLRLPRLTRPVNILVLGIKVLTSDLEEAVNDELGYHALVNTFEGLSDTMLLLRFNPRTGQLVVMSIPRDTRVLVNGVLTKINEANLDGGPALTAESLSDLLGGVAIDRYVRINVQGVEKLIDALGGVTVNVPQDMKYQDDSQHLYINLKAGRQNLNGDEALQFLRFRYDDNGDIGRVQRQQTMMRAIIEQTLTPATIARLPKILSVIQSHVDTNLSVEELVALVGYGSRTSRSDVQMLMLPGNFSSPEDYDRSYWLPSYAKIDSMVEKYFRLESVQTMEPASPSDLRVVIQDSTGDDVAIQSLIDSLYDSGYRNVSVGYDLNELLPETRIVAQRGDRASASILKQFLRIGEVRVESTGHLDSDITIQLGEDWLSEHGAAL